VDDISVVGIAGMSPFLETRFDYNWRWIFYINIPVGAVGLLASYLVVKDPEYLKNERAELRRQPLNFD
jgi:DHA2 family multidrug resistance protein